jgi:glycosyltransferase involved in cell wall biosynthesis
MTTRRITFVLTHPVQYMSPLFRYITAERPDIDLTVLYASTPMPSQQGVGFGRSFEWDISLTDGYAHRVIAPSADGRRFDAESFTGADVGPIDDAVAATRPDVVIVPGWHSRFYLRVIAECRRLGVPVLYRGDSNLVNGRRGLLRPMWAARTTGLLRLFDGYLSVGTRSREYLRRFGVPEPLIVDSPHAIDNDRFARASDDHARTAMRHNVGAADDDYVVLFAGKFVDIKRPADVCAAAARLAAPTLVVMAGDGPMMAETRVAAEQLAVRTKWCGFVNQADMPALLAAADCVAVPSQSESWGLIVNEALACGTPCVVSDRVGCAPDLIRDGVSGAMYPTGDPEALAAALTRVREARRLGTIRADSCRSAVQPYSFASAAEGMRRAADRVLARRQTAMVRTSAEPRVIAALGNMVSVFGLERMTFEVLRALRREGAAVHCVVNRWQSSRLVDMADEMGASWSTGYYWYELRRRATFRGRLRAAWDVARTSLDLLRDARRFRPTHVLAPEFNAVLRSAPALWVLRRLGVRVILRLGNAPEPGAFYEFLWSRVIDRCVDQYVPNSKFIEHELLAHGISARKSRVVYNTVPQRAHEWQPQQPIPGRIIFVGQVIPPKGLDLLLNAVGQLRARGFDLSLDVVGDIEGWEAPEYAGYRSLIRERAVASDLAGIVRFLGVREDVPDLMSRAALHCMPSRMEQKEGFTVTTLEAKRAGLPSIVTPSGALPEMVRHRVDGWLCRDTSADALAEGLAFFLADPARARDAGEQARASERAYNPQRFTSEWTDVFATGRQPLAAPAHLRSS